MTRIRPHLWYDTEAPDAADLYVSTFPDSKITSAVTLHDTPSGDVPIVAFELFGQPFQAISAGPLFRFTPAISFLISCESRDEVDAYWKQLADGGTEMMPLGAYPFSEWYGWTQDRYGLSWQVMHTGARDISQKITPMLLFAGDLAGKAEEAVHFYASVFPASSVSNLDRWGAGEGSEREGTIKHGAFTLDGHAFNAMDSAGPHDFTFNEAVSLVVDCRDQAEIDRYWQALSAVPEAEQCGWLKDRFGVSWQIVPTAMDEMMERGTPEQMARVTEAFLQMKKFDLVVLREAYDGSSMSL